MSKAYTNNFAAAYKKKAYVLFSSRRLITLRLHIVRPKDAVEPAKQRMAWYTGFPVNAVKSASARLEDLCKTELKDIRETSELSKPTGQNPL